MIMSDLFQILHNISTANRHFFVKRSGLPKIAEGGAGPEPGEPSFQVLLARGSTSEPSLWLENDKTTNNF
jgi:hypothetical protein